MATEIVATLWGVGLIGRGLRARLIDVLSRDIINIKTDEENYLINNEMIEVNRGNYPAAELGERLASFPNAAAQLSEEIPGAIFWNKSDPETRYLRGELLY